MRQGMKWMVQLLNQVPNSGGVWTHDLRVSSPSCYCMMMASYGNIFRLTGPLQGESASHRWIPLTKANDVELWCFLWSAPEQMVEQTIETSVSETPSHSLWRHRNCWNRMFSIGYYILTKFSSTACTESCHFGNFWRSQCWKFCQIWHFRFIVQIIWIDIWYGLSHFQCWTLHNHQQITIITSMK